MKLTIPIKPTSKLTGKIVKRGNYAGIAQTDKQIENETTLIQAMLLQKPEKKLYGPLALGVWAYMPLPKKSAWWREAALAGLIKPTTKPDMSNLIKQIEDCLVLAGFIEDDKQVVTTLPGGKRYSDNPRWEITLIELWEPKTAKEYAEYKQERELQNFKKEQENGRKTDGN